MLEAAVVIGQGSVPLYWHTPSDRHMGGIPDSTFLWDALWANRNSVVGVAHTHPGEGIPAPSWTDLTSFAAIEAGLGKRLRWWISSADRLIALTWRGPRVHDYQSSIERCDLDWLSQLRALSHYTR